MIDALLCNVTEKVSGSADLGAEFIAVSHPGLPGFVSGFEFIAMQIPQSRRDYT